MGPLVDVAPVPGKEHCTGPWACCRESSVFYSGVPFLTLSLNSFLRILTLQRTYSLQFVPRPGKSQVHKNTFQFSSGKKAQVCRLVDKEEMAPYK
ncbi:hypothetical protein K1719_009653 [Acacia pycnantha]|nr:hypothetical protein K1719_009653 [Acacia pycnantha]